MKRWLIVTTLFLLAAALFAGWMFIEAREDRLLAERTEALLAEWKAAGGAEKLAELMPDPVPEHLNAAVLYQQAFDIYKQLSMDEQDAITELTFEPIEQAPDERARIEALAAVGIKKLAPAIELAIEAGKRPHVCWDSAMWSEGLMEVVRERNVNREFARALVIAARFAAEDRDLARAVQLLYATRQLGVHSTSPPTNFTMLTGHVMLIDTLEEFEKMFCDRPLSSQNLKKLLQPLPVEQLLRRLVLIEGTGLLEYMKKARGDGELTETEYHAEAQHLISLMLRVLDELDKPPAERDFQFLENDEAPSDAEYGGLWGPALYQTIVKDRKRMDLRVMIAKQAVQLRRYREKHGEYPEPEEWQMPADPRTGKPLIYRKTDDGGFEIDDSMDDPRIPTWRWQ